MFSYVSPRLSWLRKNVRGKIILDIGFVGAYETPSAHLAVRQENPGSTVVGIDIVRKKVLHYEIPGSIVGSGFLLPIKPNAVDTVVLGEILEHVSNWNDLLEESVRVLRKNGALIVTTPNPFGVFRFLRYWLLAPNPQNAKNLKSYFGASDHMHFIEPLSLLRALTKLNLKPAVITTTNLSVPYIPKLFKDPDWSFWPLTRLGTYTCIKAVKR
ncbi:MAG: hypothetical protein A2900_03335 [Candidatus Chisholmbacteria bacterium RIFCSPLOWO2_01_FULL_50_28]|uniref:Methyltransferase type 11 domain-containing protein n=1 Tax=Candidatus Chisholmbacteria bacterium RIFCSPHIGHO2_01_FULL_52_32 TaxID=1797591 RepID=A0A1G1VSZ8_9BACT|nr:MAG: hypothetical protein A2786_03410 [Candidatus Chisholmbacteria bacterium RIFCSPHIGHO2_01_FULL_52_32]OGY20110.1 MAG: hypothetical protein A2900_03335 [Candidatus Chisholmbacteria bacterium RIFCSPLOWO2_01_FULL_50_28]